MDSSSTTLLELINTNINVCAAGSGIISDPTIKGGVAYINGVTSATVTI